MRSCFSPLYLAIILSLLTITTPALETAKPYLVKDIRPGSDGGLDRSDYVVPMTNLYGTVFFTATDGRHGYELWKTDGTSGGTRMVKDIVPGTGGGWVGNLVYFRKKIIFTSSDGNIQRTLWRTDGTESGTYRIGYGPLNYPENLTVMGDWLYFSAYYQHYGCELCRNNGTRTGTQLVKDIRAGSSEPNQIVKADGALFFTAEDNTHGRELWKSGGTAGNTFLVKDIKPGSSSSSPWMLTPLRGSVFFEYNSDIWRSDGSSKGTEMFLEFQGPPFLKKIIGAQNILYFIQYENSPGHQLWKTDGTIEGTGLVKDFSPSQIMTGGDQILTKGDLLYYFVRTPDYGYELWKTDGVKNETSMISTIWEGTGHTCYDYIPRHLTELGDTLFFAAYDEIHGRELWKSDGTPDGTGMAADIKSGSYSSEPTHLFPHDGTLFFIAGDRSHGRELWALPWEPSRARPVIADIPDDVILDVKSYTGPKPRLLQAAQPTTWSLASGPKDASIDLLTGVVSWPDPSIADSPVEIVIRAHNAFGADTEAWTLTVYGMPEIVTIPDQVTTAGLKYTGPRPRLAVDTLPVTWALENGPSEMTIDPQTGVVRWPMAIIPGSPHTITISAENEFGQDIETWLLHVVPRSAIYQPGLGYINPSGHILASFSEGVPPFTRPVLWGTTGFRYIPDEKMIPLPGDPNGDGLCDIIQITPYGDAWVAENTGNKLETETRWGWPGFHYDEGDQGAGALPLVGDVNGDALADLIQITPDGDAWVALSAETMYEPPTRWGWLGFVFSRGRAGAPGSLPISADVNGDARFDLVQITSHGDAWVALSTETMYEPPTRWGWLGFQYSPSDGFYPLAADVDGNGLTDLVQITPFYETWVSLCNGSSFEAPQKWGGPGFSYNESTGLLVLAGDLNSDLKSDLIQIYGDGTSSVSLSRGSFFENPQIWGRWLGFTWRREGHSLPFFLDLGW